jgi:NADH dehydrogenase (ubiquinone) 1 alpha subcomplex subunit 13
LHVCVFQVDITKTTRARGPTGFQIWGLATLGIAYGFYQVGARNQERMAEKYAEREARYLMVPILQAEEDLWYLQKLKAQTDKEAEIMKNVKGYKPDEPVYLTGRWVPEPWSNFCKYGKK